MAGGEVERFRRRLQLLSEGRLVEAQDLVVGTSAAAKKAGAPLHMKHRALLPPAALHAACEWACEAAGALVSQALHPAA